MSASHTPGPWYFSPSYGLNHAPNGDFILQGSNELGGEPVLPILGRTHNFPDNAEANARLMAAAPEMLAALKRLDQFWTAEHPAGPSSPAYGLGRLTNETCQVWSDIRAAIAKAEASNV